MFCRQGFLCIEGSIHFPLQPCILNGDVTRQSCDEAQGQCGLFVSRLAFMHQAMRLALVARAGWLAF